MLELRHHGSQLVFGADPFMNDQNFVLSVLTLEEFGATGNKVSAACISLCCYAQAQATAVWLQSSHRASQASHRAS